MVPRDEPNISGGGDVFRGDRDVTSVDHRAERHTTCVNGAESIYNWIWAIGTSLLSQRGPDCLGTSSYGATWPPKVVDWLSGCKMTGCKMCDDATMQTTLRAGK